MHINDIGAIILAAGESRRMGRPKQLCRAGEKPMILYTAELCSQFNFREITVVLGAYDDSISKLLKKFFPQIKCIFNPDFSQGIGTSVSAGLRTLAKGCIGCVFFLADMPCLKGETIENILKKALFSPENIIVPSKDGRRGNPVYFAARFFPDLASLSGEQGGSAVIERYKDSMVMLPVMDDGIFFDIDTEKELEEYNKHFRGE